MCDDHHMELTVVNEDGEEEVVTVGKQETFRTFAVNVVKFPKAVFYSPQGVRLPKGGNVFCLTLPLMKVHMRCTSVVEKIDCRSFSHKMTVRNVPFLHLEENGEVLSWTSKCLSSSFPSASMTVTLEGEEVEVSYDSERNVTVLKENGDIETWKLEDWIPTLPSSQIYKTCYIVSVSERFVYFGEEEGEEDMLRADRVRRTMTRRDVFLPVQERKEESCDKLDLVEKKMRR